MTVGLDRVLWVIQSNRLGFAHTHDVYKLTSFLDHQRTPYEGLEFDPASPDPIRVTWDGPVVCYGSTELIARVHDQRGTAAALPPPGVWYDPECSTFYAVRRGYGDLLLNADGSVVPLGNLLERSAGLAGEVFIRPAEDLKVFVGGVRSFRELPALLDRSTKSRATPETLVLIASPKAIAREWRTIVVDGRVITGSQYRAQGQPTRHGAYGTLDDRVVAFAQDAARRYQPAPVFVLDIGEMQDGSLRIVEINCFNCAGWYWSDFYKVAREVTAFAARG